MSEVTDPDQRSDDCCYLTTTGRRSGRPHRIEIWYALHEETLYLLSGAGRASDWVQNLCAEPVVTVEVDGHTRRGEGRVVEAAGEAEQARSLVFAKYAPRDHGDLTRWRDSALPLAIALAQS